MRSLAITLTLLAAAQAQSIFLVRHAEKTAEKENPSLSEAGKKRAECLAQTLKGAGIAAIYVSDTARAQQTAEPLAAELKLKPIIVPAKDYDALVAKLREHKYKNALVIGHSNTLPEIIEKLGAGKIDAIADDEYDKMFLVTHTAEGMQVKTLPFCKSAK
ncbi:MAG: histidine phosphatase family protein [Acidobacteriales bacterium]|nr:histidine phosphatase family protein [Terriglobales bacterium]